jgi:hypothetical protein
VSSTWTAVAGSLTAGDSARRAMSASRRKTARSGDSRSLPPRLTLFRDDLIVWRTFAFAIGVFVFSVTTALVIGDQRAPHWTPTRSRGTAAWVLGKFQGTRPNG